MDMQVDSKGIRTQHLQGFAINFDRDLLHKVGIFSPITIGIVA